MPFKPLKKIFKKRRASSTERARIERENMVRRAEIPLQLRNANVTSSNDNESYSSEVPPGGLGQLRGRDSHPYPNFAMPTGSGSGSISMGDLFGPGGAGHVGLSVGDGQGRIEGGDASVTGGMEGASMSDADHHNIPHNVSKIEADHHKMGQENSKTDLEENMTALNLGNSQEAQNESVQGPSDGETHSMIAPKSMADTYLSEDRLKELKTLKENHTPRFLYRAVSVPTKSKGDEPMSTILGLGAGDISTFSFEKAREILSEDLAAPLSDSCTKFAIWTCSLLQALLSAFNEVSKNEDMYICILDVMKSSVISVYATQILLHEFEMLDDSENADGNRYLGEYLVDGNSAEKVYWARIPWEKLVELELLEILLPELTKGELKGDCRVQITQLRSKLFDAPTKPVSAMHDLMDAREADTALAIADTFDHYWKMPALVAFSTLRRREEEDGQFIRVAMKVPGGYDYPRYFMFKNPEVDAPKGLPELEQFGVFSCILLEKNVERMIGALPAARAVTYLKRNEVNVEILKRMEVRYREQVMRVIDQITGGGSGGEEAVEGDGGVEEIETGI